MSEPLIAWIDSTDATPQLLGGKFGSLAEMVEAGFAVPPGFGITTAAYSAFASHGGLDDQIRQARGDAATDDLPAIQAASDRIAALIAQAPLPEQLEQEVRSAYAELERRAGQVGVPVAVRSSGVLEDTAGASFAGQYDTFLWVVGADAVLEHVRLCWAGLFGPQVLTYDPARDGAGQAQAPSMCVGIQQMVDATAAGVCFTLDPVTGDRSKIVIEAVWGLGEGVVSGDVSPDRFRVDKVTLEILGREIASKAQEHRLDRDSGEVRLLEVEPERRDRPCLDDGHIAAVATEAKKIERHRRAPMDIEWAVDTGGRIHVLQVRPETVWSRKAAERLTAPGESGLQRVLSGFMPRTDRS